MTPLALLPLERSGACYCLWQFPTRLVPLEEHGGRQDEKYICFKDKQGDSPLLPLKRAGQVVPGAFTDQEPTFSQPACARTQRK